jgi:exodeoxyribonuclease V alpha subunit
MTTHLSARLAWHDRGWDGHVCDNPHLNSSCVIAEYIRDHFREIKDPARNAERAVSGQHFAELTGGLPPCSRDPGAFAPRGYTLTHHDPLDFRNLPSVAEELAPYTFCPSPYRWMREESFRDVCDAEGLSIRGPDDPKKKAGWVYEPDRQRALLQHFWGKLEPHRSLVLFYCNRGNPLDDEAARIIVGAGRIVEVGQQLYFGKTKNYPDQYPVWSRRITHAFPKEGFRLPYQEYLRAGYDPQAIICRVPAGSLLDFSYVAEHVSDDRAVGVLERLIQSVIAVRDERKIAGEWDRHLKWLNDVLSEVWVGRGAFPGLGSVLQSLGMQRGTALHRALAPRERRGQNIWEYVKAVLEGRQELEEAEYRSAIGAARERWNEVPPSRRDLLASLVRFELTPDQVARVSNPDKRERAGIGASEAEIVANPYLLSEQDQGDSESNPIAVETIDRGMRPEGDAALFTSADERPAQDDSRRVRAVATAVLKEAAQAGDALLPLSEAIDRIARYFPERRACQPDRDVLTAQSDFYNEALSLLPDGDPPTLALKEIAEAEKQVRDTFERRVVRSNPPVREGFDWAPILEAKLGDKASAMDGDAEARARAEKTAALNILCERRLSALVGRAGTGKTSVLEVFLAGLEQLEGKQSVLLLAPTGKARVRLSNTTHRNASTIHQLLLRRNWLRPETFTIKHSGGTRESAPTVIVDEASMLPIDLLAALFRAVDLNMVKRLIFVGDPNQLPPIGPGRPFVDLVAWLEADPNRAGCIARLTERARHEDRESRALRLADGYLRDDPPPGDDEFLSEVARGTSAGDLEVHFWRDAEELEKRLDTSMVANLELDAGGKAYEEFNRSLGIPEKAWQKAEQWQILSPTRNQPFGTSEINRRIQQTYKGGLITWSQRHKPRPFGDEEIVATDKVIQIFNRSMKGWPQGQGLDYVANGEIGIVARTTSTAKGEWLDVAFSSQADVTYRYFRSQINENLELAYALSVHKAQGSDFDIVFFILPQAAATLSRELIYTALTRFRKKLVLLVEKDTAALEMLRRPEKSATLLRNSNLFQLEIRPEDVARPFAANLIHRTAENVLVRSKSEVVVADILSKLGVSYEYEKRLESQKNPKDFRLPDFTVSYEGDVFYWEHLGMLSVPSYAESWKRKEAWYRANGFADQLITSEDRPDGGIDAAEIERIARKRILKK